MAQKKAKKNKSIKQKQKKIAFWKPLLLVILVFILSLHELFLNGQSTMFWALFILSIIIILPNLIWLKFNLGTIFGVPYIVTMLKTKYFVKTINNLSKHANILEKISIGGLFLGFGLAGVDYWVAREKKGWKRLVILIFSSLILGLVFWFSIRILFSVPALEPLLLFGLICFVFLGLGGLSIGILLGYGVLSIIAFFSLKQICPSIAPVIPGVPIPGLGMVVPLIAWISLGMILIIHEFSHGIMLLKYKEKIRSVGLILFGIVPMGAFVEQDDNSFMKRSEKKQIVVLSAGPSSNLFTMGVAMILVLIFGLLFAPVMSDVNNEFEKTYSGIKVSVVNDEVSFCGITEDAPAKGKLFENDEVLALNGVDINSIGTLNNVFRNSDKNFMFSVLRNGEEIDVRVEAVLFEDLNIKQVGAGFAVIPTDYKVDFFTRAISILYNSISSILGFFIVLSFAVGMFNFLPSDPLDGGRIAKFILPPYFSFLKMNKKDTQKFIGRLFAWLFLITILVNLLPYITMFIF